MTWVELVLTLIKIVVVIAFLMNMAALTVWADRRQGALIQHRVGPNRAVVYLRQYVVQAIIAVPAIGVGAAISIPFWRPARGLELARITTGVELAVLVGWLSLLLLSIHVRKHGPDNRFEAIIAEPEPRTYFYGGLLIHLVSLGLVRLVPSSFYERGGVQWGAGLAGGLAAMVIMFSGLYATSKVPDGKVGIRLAGTLHALADALKMIWKEDLRPKNADRLLFALAPLLGIVPALVTFAVIPFGSTLCFKDADRDGTLGFGDLGGVADVVARTGQCAARELPVHLQVADLDVGLLYVFAIGGTGIIGAAIAGWASDSKFALMGGLRAASQMVSYEVALGLAVIPILMIMSSVHMQRIVDWQGEHTWGIFAQPLAFILFLTATVAETKRIPFDQPEGESEIVAGYFVEYSGMKWGLFMMGEYVEFVFSSALLVTLFFGGYHLPFLHADGLSVAFGENVVYELKMSHLAVVALQTAAFFGKTVLVTFLQVFIRWTLPRFRYDQLMKLGWTRLLPLAIGNILLTGMVVLAIDGGGQTAREVTDLLAQISQGVIAVGGLLGAVAAVTWLLEPSRPKRLVQSSAARYAAAAGGVKATEMQA